MRLIITSFVTLGILSSLVFGVVFSILIYTGFVNVTLAIGLTVAINLLFWLIGPRISDWIYGSFYKAHFLTIEEIAVSYPLVADILKSTATKYNFRVPKFAVIPDQNPTAFSYGSGRYNSRIVVTEGLFHFLSPEEVRAVVAHELGHVVHRDFIVMMIGGTLVQILYEIYAVFIRARGKNAGGAQLIGLVAWVFYIIGTYILLFLSRVREYFADMFSAEETVPEDLANALIKIGYGIVTTQETDKDKHLLASTRHLGIVDVNHIQNIGVVSYITANNPDAIAEVMLFDFLSPWAALAQLSSTHPLTGRRIKYLGEIAQRLSKPFKFDFNAALSRLPVDKSRLYFSFFVGSIIYFLPALSLILGFFFAPIYLYPGVIGIAILIKLFYRYPLSKATPSTVLEEMKNPYASPVKGKPVSFSGQPVGRGVPGFILNADLMYQDKTGLIFIAYHSALGFIGNIFFALARVKALFGQASVAEGWFFRGMASQMVMKSLKTNDKTVKSHPILWSLLLPAILIAIAIYLATALYPTNISIGSYIFVTHYNSLTQTATVDTLINAQKYSIGNRGSYTGYHSTITDKLPACSGPLITNISPDGSQVAVFGKVCHDSLYYCSTSATLFNGTMALAMGGSLPTIPASFVTPNKFDCTPLAASAPVIEATSSINTSVEQSSVQNVPVEKTVESATIKNVEPTWDVILTPGESYKISWSSQNLPSDATITVYLLRNGQKITLAKNISPTESGYEWKVFLYPPAPNEVVDQNTLNTFVVNATYAGGQTSAMSSQFYIH